MKRHLAPGLQLDYLAEYPLGRVPPQRHRHVLLRPGSVQRLDQRLEFFRFNTFGWKLARQMEGREDVDDAMGIWPINCWRCERRFGTPGSDIFPRDMLLADASAQTYAAGREMRVFCYHRAANALEARLLIDSGHEVRYATEITPEWYDPPNGTITVPDKNPSICGSHAVPLLRVDNSDGQYFVFQNSWGAEWGFDGWGAISFEHFDRFIIEAWNGFGPGLFAPICAQSGIVCLEWKWSANNEIGVHGRELVHAPTGERLAWAFCQRRDRFLDIEEFYVWPSERGKGYGRVLASMTMQLAAQMGLPMRLLVSYADTEPHNESNVQAVARLLSLELMPSPERWVHLFGTKTPAGKAERETLRPQRPAFIVERLRPKDEKPIETPIEYCVFFGTNRRPLQHPESDAVFGSQRDSRLHTGKLAVKIPTTHRFGSKGRSWMRLWKRVLGKNPRLVSRSLFANDAQLADELKTLLDGFTDEPHNLLFVHGFNVGFKAAALQAAYFGVDLKVPGATFLFSWPSAGHVGGYMADEAAIDASLPFLATFMESILLNTSDIPLSVIAHSMGSRMVLRYLDDVASGQRQCTNGRIRNVVFAAPDVDADEFKSKAARCISTTDKITLYSTRADLALLSSQVLHSYPRAGLAPPVLTVPGMDTILVEHFNVCELAHSYCAEASGVLHDMFNLLRFGSDPANRPRLVSAETIAGERFWKLPL